MQLQSYITAHGLSRPAFAARIGVTPQALHRYLSGARVPHKDVLRRIAEATDGAVQPNDFFQPADAA